MASLQFENGPLDDDTLMKKRPANALFNVCNALCNARSADFFFRITGHYNTHLWFMIYDLLDVLVEEITVD